MQNMRQHVEKFYIVVLHNQESVPQVFYAKSEKEKIKNDNVNVKI